VKLAITGDVMLGRLVNRYVIQNPKMDPAYVWGDCLPLLHQADLRLINLECVIAESGERWRPESKVFHFCARPRAIEFLKAARIDFVSLANNHTLDYNAQALDECIGLLERAPIAHAGAGRSDRAREPAFLHALGKTAAIVSITDNEPDWEVAGSKPGVFYVRCEEDGLPEPYRAQVSRAMEKARSSSDVVIVSAHVGSNWGRPSSETKALARQLIDMGADCYWGHSNHTPREVEIYRGRPILYSTGDFIDDYAVDPIERNDLSFLYMLDWRDTSWKLTMYPTKITDFQARRVHGDEACYVMNRIERFCRDVGTNITREDETLIISWKSARSA
jgi:poly-gamma-glutamate synthesis protein (capsule biosynthesis protein)